MILATQPETEIMLEAGNGREPVEVGSRLKPDWVVMDVAIPEVNGIEVPPPPPLPDRPSHRP